MRGNTFNQPEVEHIGFLQTVDETDKETYLSINTLRPFLAGFLWFYIQPQTGFGNLS